MRNPFKKLDRGFFLIAFIVLLFLVGAVVLYILFHSDSVSDLVNRNESFSVLTVVHDGDTEEYNVLQSCYAARRFFGYSEKRRRTAAVFETN